MEPTGEEMTDEAWDEGYVKCLGVRLAGDLISDVDERGEPITGETLLMLLNAHWESLPFTLEHGRRTLGGDPQHGRSGAEPTFHKHGEEYELADRSMACASPAARARGCRPDALGGSGRAIAGEPDVAYGLVASTINTIECD